MTIQNFYIQSGGDDLAGGSGTGAVTGSDTGGAGVVLQGGGAGGGTMDLYTGTGTPFSATQVGDYVSIYTGTPSATSYVAQVTAVNSGGLSVDYQSTTGYGVTRPTNGSTYKAKTGGAWADMTPLVNFGAVTVPGSTTINCKSNATLGGAAAQTIALKGAATTPLRIAGYVNTPGDLDMPAGFPGMVAAGTSYPAITYTSTGRITLSGADVELSGFNITCATNNATVSSSGTGFKLHNCIVSNTNNGTTSFALSLANTGPVVTCSDLSVVGNCSAILGAGAIVLLVDSTTLSGNSTGSGQHGITVGTTTSGLIAHKVTFVNLGGDGINNSGLGVFSVVDCTFKACVVSGIVLVAVPTSSALIASNYFYNSGVYNINNSSGINTCLPILVGNVNNNAGTSHLNGFGDWPEFGALTDSGNPFVSSTDLHLSSGTGQGAGLPGPWTGLTAGLKSTPDVGAWQRAVTPPGGGGSIIGSGIINPISVTGG